MDIRDQRRTLLLHGREARRLPEAIAREHLRRGYLEEPALLERGELPRIGNREESLQSGRR
jgi:hypothetical protein